jgi:threonine/homoserine/homoserine lactone efflux protein
VFCWALAAGAGLTALLRANAILFTGMHLVGAGVLVYLGVSAWRSARREEGEFGEALQLRLPAGRTPAASFRASLVTIAANPKAAVFAFTFFPQFLPRHGSVFAAAATLAAIQVVVIDAPYCAMIVLLASRARTWLSRATIRRRMERILGATLVCLGIDLAAAR